MKNVNRELWTRPKPIPQCQIFFPFVWQTRIRSARTTLCIGTIRARVAARFAWKQISYKFFRCRSALRLYVRRTRKRRRVEKNVRKNKNDANTETIFHRNEFGRSAIQSTSAKVDRQTKQKNTLIYVRV